MFKPFSRRKNDAKGGAKPLDLYSYDIEINIRNRILHTLNSVLEKSGYPDLFGRILREVQDSCHQTRKTGS